MKKNSIARDISYSFSGKTKVARAVIRTVENLTGRPRLIKKAKGYELEVAQGNDFWEVMSDRYNIKMDFISGGAETIPQKGPLIVIANHPFGILDGLVMGNLLSRRREDFRIIANHVFRKSKDLNDVILPISFEDTRDAMRTNLETRNKSLTYLAQGGCIGIFPGGTVSTSSSLLGRPMDPQWRNFTAKMIQKSNATVLPIYFEGANSRLFQIASHANQNLRVSLLIREFKKNIKQSVRLVVGNPVPNMEIKSYGKDSTGLMDYLREETYKLSPKPLGDLSYGYEFEEQYKRPKSA